MSQPKTPITTTRFESLPSANKENRNSGSFFSKLFSGDDRAQKDFGPLPDIEYSEDISKYSSQPVVISSSNNTVKTTTTLPASKSNQSSPKPRVLNTTVNKPSPPPQQLSNSVRDYSEINSSSSSVGSDTNSANNRLIEVFKSKFQKNAPVVENENKKFWMPDHSSPVCYECSAVFTTFKRRHHCRLCGQIFCWRCSNNYLLDHKGDNVRVCNFCYKRYLEENDVNTNIAYSMALSTLKEKQNESTTGSTGSNETNSTPAMTSSTGTLFNKMAVSITSPFTKGLYGSSQSVPTEESPPNSMIDDTLMYFKDQEGNYDLVEEDENNLADSDSDDEVGVKPLSSSSSSLLKISDAHIPPPPPIPENRKTTRSYTMPHRGSITSFSMSSLPSVIKFQKSNPAHHSTSPPKHEMPTSTTDEDIAYHNGMNNSTGIGITVTPDQGEVQSEPGQQEPSLTSSNGFFSPMKNRQGQQIVITPSSLFFSDPSIVSLKSHPKTTNKSKFLENYPLPMQFYESNLNNFSVKPAIDKDKISNQPNMEPYTYHILQIVTRLLESNGIDPNIWRSIIMDYTKKSIDRVKINVKNGGKMSTNEHIKIKKIPGGTINECQYIDGVVLTKILTHKKMKSKFISPKILLLNCSVEFQRVENKFLFFDQLLQQEKDYLRILVSKIIDYKPDLVLVEKTVSRFAQEFLLEAGISLALNIKPKILERLGRCLGGELLPSLNLAYNTTSNPTIPVTSNLEKLKHLGTCGVFRIQNYNIEGYGKKSLMFFEKCPPEFGSTIVLRGESLEKLEIIKKILKFSVFAIRNAYLELKMIQNSSSFFYKELASCDYFLSASPQIHFPCPKTYPAQIAQWKYKFTSLHTPNKRSLMMSMFLPYAGEAAQQQAVLQNTTEDEIVGIGTSDALLQCNSPHFNFSIQDETVYDHQSITYSHSIFCNATQCIPFELHTINYYSENDLTIGEFLLRCCFNPQDCTIRECNRPLLEHERTFMHNNCRVNIFIKRAPPNSNSAASPKNHSIHIINLCKTCKKFSPEVPLSADAWEYSFGKFLESAFYGFLPLSTQADCNHYQMKDHILYFYYQDLVAIFSFDNLPRLELSLPPITTRFDSSHNHPKQKLVVRKKELELLNECANQVYSAIHERCMELQLEYHDRVKELLPSLMEEKQLIINKIGELLIEVPMDKEPILDLSKTLYANFMTWNSQLTGIANSASYQRSKRNLHSSFDPDTIMSVGSGGGSNNNTPNLEKRLMANLMADDSTREYPNNSNNSYNASSNSTSSFGSNGSANNLNLASGAPLAVTSQTSTSSMINLQDNQQSMDYSSPVVQQALSTLEVQKQQMIKEQQILKEQQKAKEASSGSNSKPLKLIDTIAGIVSSISSTKILGPTIPYILLDSDDKVALYENEPSTTIAYTLTSTDYKATLQTLIDEELYKPNILDGTTNSPPTNSNPTTMPTSTSSTSLNGLNNNNNDNNKQATPGSSNNNSPSISLTNSVNGTNPIPINNNNNNNNNSYGDERSSLVAEIKDDSSFLRQRTLTDANKKKPLPMLMDLRSSTNSSPIGSSPGTLSPLMMPERSSPLILSTQSSPLMRSSTSNLVITPPPIDQNEALGETANGNSNEANKNENPTTTTIEETQSEVPGSPVSIDMYSETNMRLSKLMMSDQRKEIRSRFKFEKNGYELSVFCTSYYPIQFHALREFVVGDREFIESLTRSKVWNAKGGKSGSSWSKTLDEKYILKQVSRVELESFLDFAPLYFEYLCRSLLHKIPTALCKILGVYSVRWKDSNGKSFKKDLIIMENLFYSKYILKTYDLKGSLRGRLVKNESEVLLDENLLQASFSTPICLPEYEKTRLATAVWNDTAFLSSLNVMDYSLLTGIDNQGQLIVGIIDYMRKFTWDKVIEMKVKQSGIMGGGGKVPTVISPKQYKIRFRDAMWLYFTVVPDKFTKVNHLQSPQSIKKREKDKLLKEMEEEQLQSQQAAQAAASNFPQPQSNLPASLNSANITSPISATSPITTFQHQNNNGHTYKNQVFI